MKNDVIARDCFNQVINGKVYDLERAQQHFNDSALFLLPIYLAIRKSISFVEKEKKGGCVHFSLYLASLLDENGINSRCATIPAEGSTGIRNANHCCVWLELNGKEYISDPVEAVKANTNGADPFEHFLIPLHKFMEDNLRDGEEIRIYSSLYKNTMQLGTFFNYPETKLSL